MALTEQQLFAMMGGYSISRMLQVAHRVGLLEAASRGPKTSGQLARRCRTNPEMTRRLCRALTALRIFAQRGKKFSLPTRLHQWLTPTGYSSICGSLELGHDSWETMTDYERVLRTGRPRFSMIQRIKKEPKRLDHFIHAMHGKSISSAAIVARTVGLRDVKNLLDLGGGPGTYALEWLKHNRGLRATIYDLPNVLRITRSYIQRYKLQSRVRVKGGDFIRDGLGSGYDLILAANVLQMYGPKEATLLVRKAARALAPSGRLVIHGYFTDGRGTKPKEGAIFSVFIGTVTPDGRAHRHQDVLKWMREAGLTRCRHLKIRDVPPDLFVGYKS